MSAIPISRAQAHIARTAQTEILDGVPTNPAGPSRGPMDPSDNERRQDRPTEPPSKQAQGQRTLVEAGPLAGKLGRLSGRGRQRQ